MTGPNLWSFPLGDRASPATANSRRSARLPKNLVRPDVFRKRTSHGWLTSTVEPHPSSLVDRDCLQSCNVGHNQRSHREWRAGNYHDRGRPFGYTQPGGLCCRASGTIERLRCDSPARSRNRRLQDESCGRDPRTESEASRDARYHPGPCRYRPRRAAGGQ